MLRAPVLGLCGFRPVRRPRAGCGTRSAVGGSAADSASGAGASPPHPFSRRGPLGGFVYVSHAGARRSARLDPRGREASGPHALLATSRAGRGLGWGSAAVRRAENFSPPPRDESPSGSSVPARLARWQERHVWPAFRVRRRPQEGVGKVPFFRVSWKQKLELCT